MTAIRTIHTLKNRIGFDDDTYRDFLEKHTGSRSSKGMTSRQHGAVISELKKLAPQDGKRATGRFAKKLQALWIAGYNLGVVENKSDQAMMAWLKRQTGLDHHRFLSHADDAARAIDALKIWIRRDTGNRDLFTHDKARHRLLNDLRFQVCLHIWTELFKQNRHPSGSLDQLLRCVSGKEGADLLSDGDWIKAMNHLGRFYRKPTP
ncbi:regulatory protein GemA [Roseibium sp.]|uniref:regulatory protein GemA n=1 Tax=Roseibium sp. TaxID=1936156 RepID=UPI003D0CF809